MYILSKRYNSKTKFNKQMTFFFLMFLLFMFAISFVFAVSRATNAPFLSIFTCYSLIILLFYKNLKLFTIKGYSTIYIVSFTITNLLLIYQSIYKDLPLGGRDYYLFHTQAETIINETSSLISIFTHGEYFNFFSRVVAVIYYVFGVSLEQVYFFIFITSLITLRYIFKTTYILMNDYKKAQIVSIIWVLWPAEVIHSITFLREMPIQLLFIMSLYYFIGFIKSKKNYLLFFLAIALSIAATILHSGMIGVVISYLFVATVFNSNKGINIVNSPLKIGVFLIFMMILINSPLGELMTTKYGNVDDVDGFIEKTSRVEGNTAYVNSTPENTLDIILETPYRIIMFAMAPFPWQIYDVSTLMAWLLDGVLRIFIVWKLFEFFKKFKPANDHERIFRVLFILILLLTYLIYAWGTFTYGTAMRHRLKLFPLEIILIIPYLSIVKERVKNHQEELKKKIVKKVKG